MLFLLIYLAIINIVYIFVIKTQIGNFDVLETTIKKIDMKTVILYIVGLILVVVALYLYDGSDYRLFLPLSFLIGISSFSAYRAIKKKTIKRRN